MSHKLLLADDSITIQKVVELVLAEEDFEIRSVSNGEDALNLMDTFKPDIVLADVEMPKINGYQLCEKIKQNSKTANIPVILLAGAFEPIDENLSLKVGADDSVIKPFESQELISKINAALTMASAEGQEDFTTAEIGDEEAVEIVEAEAVEFAGAEEDLWEMEEVTAAPEKWIDETAAAEEKTEIEEAYELPEKAISGEPELSKTAGIIQPAAGEKIVMPEIQVPSKDELIAIFEKTIDKKVSEFLSDLDIKASLLSSLTPLMKDSIEKILWEVAPELVEKMLKEILKGSIASLTAEVEKVIWETVPDLAATMISKEIEKIKSGL